MADRGVFHFTVSSRLIRELGERLVGHAYAALAELIKNSFDADARDVEITIDTVARVLCVEDNGSGMRLEDFENRFMRIGSTHKVVQRVSDQYRRRLTGSKGIGRLAAQFLGSRLEILTCHNAGFPLRASIAWDDAKTDADLTSVSSEWERLDSVRGGFLGHRTGTKLTISGLREAWGPEMLEHAAAAVRSLRSPFPSSQLTTKDNLRDPGMAIRFLADSKDVTDRFEKKVGAILDIWIARIEAHWSAGVATYKLYWRGVDEPIPLVHEFNEEWLKAIAQDEAANHRARLWKADATRFNAASLADARLEVRFYKLKERQPEGIPVSEAREYFEEWGGIHVFDAGFRLPFYGDKENDWLRVAHDQTQRRTRSLLLPQSVGSTGTIQFLPDMNRMFGVVSVDTNAESHSIKNPLTLAITRDRLVENPAFMALQVFVRFAIDWFAILEAKRVWDDRARKPPPSPEKHIDIATRAFEAIAKAGSEVPPEAWKTVEHALRKAKTAAIESRERADAHVSLLAALATAGMSAVAYRHELDKLLVVIRDEARSLVATVDPLPASRARAVGDRLERQWNAIRSLESLFSFVADKESRTDTEEYLLADVINETLAPIRPLAPHVKVAIDPSTEVTYLPRATLTEWTALFRNLLTNAFQSVMGQHLQEVRISAEEKGSQCAVFVDDKGCGLGVPIKMSDELFQPFARRIEVTDYVRERGLGGTGLGLTIVRMIAEQLGLVVRFTTAPHGWSTRVVVSWTRVE